MSEQMTRRDGTMVATDIDTGRSMHGHSVASTVAGHIKAETEFSRAPRARSLGDAGRGRNRQTGFEHHPAFQEIMATRSLGPIVGLKDPHYREHPGRPAAHTVLDGRTLINFASYDYLGLNGHPEVLKAHSASALQHGTSVSGSRVTCGERSVHRELERALAENYGTAAGLVFVSGHATAGSVIHALMGPRDLILHDEFIHNCVAVGAQAVACQRKSYRHGDTTDLEAYLARNRNQFRNVLIVTEGLFSMDGDGCDLAELIRIKEAYGAWLMVDEAHALGVLGETGRGIAEHLGLDGLQVDIWYGTLSKTLVGCGGFICGSQALIDILRARAPGMVYSVGMPAPVAAASLCALQLMWEQPERVQRLRANSQRFWAGVKSLGLNVGNSWGEGIIPIIIGDDLAVLKAANALEQRGVYSFPVLEPGVPRGTSRLRFFVSATHEMADIDRALDVISSTPLG